jgi:CHAT domain-containing protein
MKLPKLIVLILLGTISNSFSQSWLEKTLKSAAKEGSEEETAKMDKLDFQFAMSVNEGSNLFEVEQKGETVSKGILAGLNAVADEKTKTTKQIARDTLQYTIQLFETFRIYSEAERGFKAAQGYMEDNSLTDDISYLRCISSMGVFFLVQGKLGDAEKYINDALEKSDKLVGQSSAAYASNLNSLAKLNQVNGKYNEAEKLFDQSLAIALKVFGAESMQNAIVLNNKAMLFQEMGRYDDGNTIMQQAVVASEAAPKKALKGKKSFDNRKFQSNQALMYQLSGKLPEAETVFLSIKKVFENRGQTSNPEYAGLLNQLSILYMQMNKMDLVEPLLKKAAEVYKKKFSESNPSFAKVQNDLGNFYRMQGKFAEAEGALAKAVDIRKNALGENHPDYAKSIENLGILYWKKGDLSKAYTNLRLATEKSLEFVNSYFPPMSETEKTKYWDILRPRFQRFYNFAIEASAKNPAVLKDVYDYQIATKALLLNSTNKIKQAILSSGDQSLIKEYLSWINQKENLSRYYALSKEELKQQKIDLPSLEKEANASERALSQKSSDFSKAFSSEKLSFTKIATLLGDTEAVVEIIHVRTFDKDFIDESRYVALVLTKNSTVPSMVLLENGNQLETRYAKFYRNAIQQKIADDYSYEQYWIRIEPLLAGKKTIYLSPDGVYNQINLNTLKKKDGDYLLNRYDLVIIGNSKDLVALKQRKQSKPRKDAFLLGFPDYAGAATPLPGTKVEIESINKILTTAGYKTTTRQQKLASESALKGVKGPALIHIATHGYFLADADLQSGDALGVNAENAKNNPLLRSGLILAGAKIGENKSTDVSSNDNGILTAYEAMNLNLEGTDLIVLSACETGLGDVKSGEGVYGLQRAFLVAGADAMVMSLWKVDDAATQQLMTNFYTNWTKGGSKLKAFKQAQLQLMTKYKDPYFWGAFVMMGM